MTVAPMRAARFHGPGDVRIETVPRPRPTPGQVLLRVITAAICGSDVSEFRSGPHLAALHQRHPVTGHLGPVTLGHEFAGEVIELGAGVEALEEGALVTCGAGVSCGRCEPCQSGSTNLCRTYATIGYHWDGGLAEYCAVPAAICVDVGPYGLPPDAAAMAQPMAVAVHAAKRSRVAAGEDALIIGAGGIGAFLTYAVARRARHVTVMDIDARRLAQASAMGAAVVIDSGSAPDGGGPLGAREYHVVFEASGTAAGFATALANARRGTRIVVVGVQKAPIEVDLGRLTLDQHELIGTVAHVCADDLPDAIALLASRAEGWSDVAARAIGLDQLVGEGLEPMTRGEARQTKMLVDPWIAAPRPSATIPAPPGMAQRPRAA